MNNRNLIASHTHVKQVLIASYGHEMLGKCRKRQEKGPFIKEQLHVIHAFWPSEKVDSMRTSGTYSTGMFRTRKKSILFYSGAVGLLKRKDKNVKKKGFRRGSRWRLLPMSALRATLIELQPLRRFLVNAV
jgi:hypothetical protein